MAVKQILTEPNKFLRQISKPVEKVGDEERKLMDDMLDTMYAAFMGTPSFAVPILKALHKKKYLISATYTQPPQKSQRGQRYNKSPIHVISEELNIECRTP